MSIEILAFCLASFAIIVIPGPNVMVIVATSLSRGRRRGLQTVIGTSLAMLVQLLVAALGTSLLVNSLARGLVWLKWVGVFYLLYLGISSLLVKKQDDEGSYSATMAFGRGFWISLTNPKTILFFAAFLPQFVVPGTDYVLQIAMLSLLFWFMAVVLDSSYALLAARLGSRFRQFWTPRATGRLSGLVYLGAGAALASTRQS